MDVANVLPKRRLHFSLAMKQQAIAWITGPGMGNPTRAVAHFQALNWDVSPETMGKWWHQRHKLMNVAVTDDTIRTNAESSRRVLLSTSQEIALAAVIRRRARKVRVSPKWIALAVRQMYPGITSPSFSVSEKWLEAFAQRHGLALMGSTVVTSLSDASLRRAPKASKKSQTARSMSLHDVLYEEKPAATTIAA